MVRHRVIDLTSGLRPPLPKAFGIPTPENFWGIRDSPLTERRVPHSPSLQAERGPGGEVRYGGGKDGVRVEEVKEQVETPERAAA